MCGLRTASPPTWATGLLGIASRRSRCSAFRAYVVVGILGPAGPQRQPRHRPRESHPRTTNRSANANAPQAVVPELTYPRSRTTSFSPSAFALRVFILLASLPTMIGERPILLVGQDRLRGAERPFAIISTGRFNVAMTGVPLRRSWLADCGYSDLLVHVLDGSARLGSATVIPQKKDCLVSVADRLSTNLDPLDVADQHHVKHSPHPL
jgi:hypothetical protein